MNKTRFEKEEVIHQMGATGLLPVFYHEDLELVKRIVKACYGGGIRVFEYTNRGTSAADVFEQLIPWANKNYPDLMIGIGSVIDSRTTEIYIQQGADFVVSPAVLPEMAEVCSQYGVNWIPGCGTVTEIVEALRLQAPLVKLFPAAQLGGPDFIKAVLGPLPQLKVMPTGGVLPDRMALTEWFEAGAFCVGVGSQLFSKNLLDSDSLISLSATVRELLNHIKKLKGN